MPPAPQRQPVRDERIPFSPSFSVSQPMMLARGTVGRQALSPLSILATYGDQTAAENQGAVALMRCAMVCMALRGFSFVALFYPPMALPTGLRRAGIERFAACGGVLVRQGQALAVSNSPDSVSSGQLAQPGCPPKPLGFPILNQGGDVLGAGAGVNKCLSPKMGETPSWGSKAVLANLILCA